MGTSVPQNRAKWFARHASQSMHGRWRQRREETAVPFRFWVKLKRLFETSRHFYTQLLEAKNIEEKWSKVKNKQLSNSRYTFCFVGQDEKRFLQKFYNRFVFLHDDDDDDDGGLIARSIHLYSRTNCVILRSTLEHRVTSRHVKASHNAV